ncbi:hypothetical protein V6N13_118334 [Hibiscus sabdariffa]
MLEDLECSYLKEIFIKVELWSEKVSTISSRSIWIEVSSVPLHCWNHTTLSRLAKLWGTFEALGENANLVLDFEKVSILITKNVENKISESVEIVAGNMSFMVRLEELVLSDQSSRPCDTEAVENKVNSGFLKASELKTTKDKTRVVLSSSNPALSKVSTNFFEVLRSKGEAGAESSGNSCKVVVIVVVWT